MKWDYILNSSKEFYKLSKVSDKTEIEIKTLVKWYKVAIAEGKSFHQMLKVIHSFNVR